MVLQPPKEFDNEENTLGNKEIIKNSSKFNKFCLIDENDDAQKIIEKCGDLKTTSHISDESLPGTLDGVREITRQNSLQKSISGDSHSGMLQGLDNGGADLNDFNGFQTASEMKDRKISSKKDQKPKKPEIAEDQKTLL